MLFVYRYLMRYLINIFICVRWKELNIHILTIIKQQDEFVS